MQSNLAFRWFRAVGYAVLAVGAVSIIYAGYIGISNWHGIGV